MANPTHVRILEAGVETWNQWISQNAERPDLSDLNKPNMNLANIRFGGANLRRANLVGCDLTGAVLGGADLTEARLDNANLQYAHAENCVFVRCSASNANFLEAEIVDAKFQSANLIGANFSNVQARSARFDGAILRGVNFEKGRLSQSSFHKADLRRASFIQADLRKSILDEAMVWALQTSDWQQDDLVCNAAFLDAEGCVRQEFATGAFVYEYSAPRFYRVRFQKDDLAGSLTSIHALIDLIAKETDEYSIQVDSIGDSSGEIAIAVESMSNQKEEWENILAKYNLLEQSLGVEKGKKQKVIDRLNTLNQYIVEGVIKNQSQTSILLDSIWEMALIVFIDICQFSKLSEPDAEKYAVSFWRAGIPFLKKSNAYIVNTWGDAIVCVFKKPELGILDTIHLIGSLKLQNILVRGGAHFGKVWVRTNPLIERLDFGGDNVNLAARIQPSAACGELLVTQAVWAAVEGVKQRFEMEPRSIMLEKGTRDHAPGKPFRVYALKHKND